MRLREIQALLHKYLPDLNPIGSTATTADRNAANQLRGLHAYRRALDALSVIEALKPFVAPALALPFMSDSRDGFVMPQGELNAHIPTITNLINSAGLLMNALDQVAAEQNDTTVAVGLPEGGLAVIVEVTPIIEAFFKGMTGLPMGDGDDRVEEPTFVGFDVGSEWYLVDLHSIQAVILIGWMLRAVQELWVFTSRRIAEDKMLDTYVDDTEDMKEHLKKLRRAYARKLAENVCGKAAKKAKNEDLNRRECPRICVS